MNLDLKKANAWGRALLVAALAMLAAPAWAAASVQYGRITNVSLVTTEDPMRRSAGHCSAARSGPRSAPDARAATASWGASAAR